MALGPTDGAGWRPVAWPFPRDGWPPGRAWRRDTTDVYVRPKLGFCGNCDTGVVTDEEVDRVTDIDLLDERFAPVREGSRIRITDLFGRARLYKYKLKNGAQRFAEGIAVSYKCDLVVAVIVGNVTDEQGAQVGASLSRIEHRPGLGEPAARGTLTLRSQRCHPEAEGRGTFR